MSLYRITNATALYSSLLGVRSAESIGSPASELRIVYESPQGTEGDIRTLSILLGLDGTMTGAKVSLTLLSSFTRLNTDPISIIALGFVRRYTRLSAALFNESRYSIVSTRS